MVVIADPTAEHRASGIPWTASSPSVAVRCTTRCNWCRPSQTRCSRRPGISPSTSARTLRSICTSWSERRRGQPKAKQARNLLRADGGLAGPEGDEFNQLDQAGEPSAVGPGSGHERGNEYEIGLSMPADDDRRPHTRAGGRTCTHTRVPLPQPHEFQSSARRGSHLSAMYRSHDFVSRGYGNYVGLGRVFVSSSSRPTSLSANSPAYPPRRRPRSVEAPASATEPWSSCSTTARRHWGRHHETLGTFAWVATCHSDVPSWNRAGRIDRVEIDEFRRTST